MPPTKFLKSLLSITADRFGYYFGILPPSADTLSGHLRTLLAAFDINCVLDVGAHHGEFASMVRSIGYQGRIISWEPVSESYRLLSEKASCDPEWYVNDCALGSADTYSTINVTKGTATASLYMPNAYGQRQFGDKLNIMRREQIEIRQLDEVFDECVAGISNPRVFLKIDSQGHDLEVIKGGGGCLNRIVAIQTEVSVLPIYEGVPTFLESMRCLEDLGFALSSLFPVRHDKCLRLIEMDSIMVRVPTGSEGSPKIS